jgi:outer membrane protein OmpA-like peptidoglycan-associated protein
MRTSLIFLVAAMALTGCASTSSFVNVPETTLGKVVVYRNGVAYFERTARVEGDTLHLTVPADKVDDFLKSLTVIDARTNQPAPISYPANLPSAGGDLIDMQIKLQGPGPHDLRLTYVTEAPAWKPSYRLVLGQDKQVKFQAWAIVDNTSGEDWTGVKLGVGASSALSFRFDLWSVRLVQRETLEADSLFAQAPPTGGATHGGRPAEKKVLADLNEASLNAVIQQAPPPPPSPPTGSFASRETKSKPKTSAAPAKPADLPRPAGGGRAAGGSMGGLARGDLDDMGRQQQAANQELMNLARRINSSRNQVVIEGFADRNDGDKQTASLERANRVREQLLRNGVAPDKVVAVGRGEATGKQGGVRFVEAPITPTNVPQGQDEETAQKDKGEPGASDPIGISHFESGSTMTVQRGTAAMVSIYQGDTEGEVVYLFDNESPRGNATFPFRSVRLRNPTDSALESGPVTVFGEGRFIGEGLSEPIPPRAIAFIPFALDRQIVVEKKSDDRDEISRILSVQRGVFSTEVQRTRRTILTLTNRLPEKAVVYIRHTIPQGYKLTKGPVVAEKLGDASLFRVEIPAGASSDVTIEEATPVLRTADLRSAEGMGMVKLYLSSAALEGPLKQRVADLIKHQQEIGNLEQQIGTLREQMGEYRQRMDELHAQLVTLRAVKNPQGNLMQHLEKKLQEVSEKMSKATIELVSLQEKLMVTRIRFQDGVADLSLEKKDDGKKDDRKPGG